LGLVVTGFKPRIMLSSELPGDMLLGVTIAAAANTFAVHKIEPSCSHLHEYGTSTALHVSLAEPGILH
jgi:hypothetical protein